MQHGCLPCLCPACAVKYRTKIFHPNIHWKARGLGSLVLFAALLSTCS
jgi:hypothetical protein